MTRKITWSIFVGILIVVLCTGTYWTVKNWDNIGVALSGTNIYLQDDVDRAYQDGYNAGNSTKTENEVLINNYREQILSLTAQVNTLTEDNEEYATDNEALIDQLAELNQQIEYYQMLMQAYEDYNVATIEYYVNGKLYDIDVLDKGDKIELADNYTNNLPTEDNSEVLWFRGWTLDVDNVTDETVSLINKNYIVDNHIKLYAAVFTLDIRFEIAGEVVSEQTIAYKDDFVMPPENISAPAGYKLTGWYNVAKQEVASDIENYNWNRPGITVEGVVVFTGVLDGIVNINYNVAGEVYKHYEIAVYTGTTLCNEVLNLTIDTDNAGFTVYSNDVILAQETVKYNNAVLSSVIQDNINNTPYKGWTIDDTQITHSVDNRVIGGIGEAINLYYYELQDITVAFKDGTIRDFASDYNVLAFQGFRVFFTVDTALTSVLDITDMLLNTDGENNVMVTNKTQLSYNLDSINIYLDNGSLQCNAIGDYNDRFFIYIWAYIIL